MIVARSGPSEDWDVVLIGGGITSATLGVLLGEVQPDCRRGCKERHAGRSFQLCVGWE